MRVALIVVAVVGILAAACATAFYFERIAEFHRIDKTRPTYTKYDPATGKYIDYEPAKE